MGFRSSRHCIPTSSRVWKTSKILTMEHGKRLTPIHSVKCQITCLKNSAVEISYLATLLTPIKYTYFASWNLLTCTVHLAEHFAEHFVPCSRNKYE